MRRGYLWLSVAFMTTLLVSLADGQSQQGSLGDYARRKRKEKQTESAPKKVFDNDNLPKDQEISVVGSDPAPSSTETASAEKTKEEKSEKADNGDKGDKADQAAKTDKGEKADKGDKSDISLSKPKEITPDQSAEEKQATYEDWQKRIADQKQTLDLLQRELDVLQREYRLRAAAMYADAGNRMRNAAQWDKEDRQYKDEIASKQKAVDTAKQQLSNLQEQARRAGVPNKMRE